MENRHHNPPEPKLMQWKCLFRESNSPNPKDIQIYSSVIGAKGGYGALVQSSVDTV